LSLQRFVRGHGLGNASLNLFLSAKPATPFEPEFHFDTITALTTPANSGAHPHPAQNLTFQGFVNERIC
jgi:hypothetical protein